MKNTTKAKMKKPAAKRPAQAKAKFAKVVSASAGGGKKQTASGKSGKSVTGKSGKTGKSSAPEQGDVIPMILEDHQPLKKLIKIMKNLDKDLSERQNAFEEFAPLLVTHAKPEEQTVYTFLKR